MRKGEGKLIGTYTTDDPSEDGFFWVREKGNAETEEIAYISNFAGNWLYGRYRAVRISGG
jgi:hypothetical protein